MKKIISNLIRFWNEDRSLNVMLLLLLLFIFVCIPALNGAGIGGIIIKIMYSGILLTGILSATKHKLSIVVISIFAAISFFITWLSNIEPTSAFLIAQDIGSVFFNFFFTLFILVKTLREGEITFLRIEGAIVVYLLIGLIFAFLFHAVYLYEGPSSFNGIQGTELKEFLYFSLTSLTTMGYGDITPVHPIARSLANFEALIGQLYPAILIARLVSMEFEWSNRKKEEQLK